MVTIMVAVECGYWLARRAQRRRHQDKLPPVSSITASTLGLVAFMLAFTFGLVASRYDSRKSLVREEANAIRTAWMRSDFLPEPSRGESEALIRAYLDQRLGVVQSRDLEGLDKQLAEANRIQHRLWDIAVANSHENMDSPVGALYVDSLNRLIDMHALRVVVGLEAHIPNGIWLVLYGLIVLGMIGVGYQTVIAEATGRSWAPLILAISFSLVIALIASLDRPIGGFITVSQQPLQDVQAWMDNTPKARVSH